MSSKIIVDDLVFKKQGDDEWIAETAFESIFGDCYYMISDEGGEYLAYWNCDADIGTFEEFDLAVDACNSHFREMLYPIVGKHCHVDEED